MKTFTFVQIKYYFNETYNCMPFKLFYSIQIPNKKKYPIKINFQALKTTN